MTSSNRTTLTQAIGLGVLAGMRSMAAPAIVSRRLAQEGHSDSLGLPFNLLASSRAATLLLLPALGEMVADKLPMTPARIELPPLLGRIGSGALVGAAIYRARKQNLLVGLLVGALSALVSTYITYYLRRTLGEQFDIPDFALAIAEDALVVAGGLALLRSSDD